MGDVSSRMAKMTAKKPTGQPFHKAPTVFDKRLTLDLTTDDHRRLKALAATHGVTMADLLRAAAARIVADDHLAAELLTAAAATKV